MGKGKGLDDYIKNLVAEMCLKHPAWGGTKIHSEVHHVLGEQKYPRSDPEWPSRSAVQRLAKDYKAALVQQGQHEDDRPWSLAALSFCDIPPEALPAVNRACWRVIDSGAETPLTIGQAKWMGRLFYLFEDELDLLKAATIYVARQRSLELSDAYPKKGDDTAWTWFMGELGGA